MHDGMWGGWSFLAAENINGNNSVIWRNSDAYGDSFWLSIHDDQGDFIGSDDPGYPGYIDPVDPRYNDPADQKFYTTETNFNLDLNKDGSIGEPPLSLIHI